MSTYNLGQIGLNFRDAYSASTAYSKLDVVTYNGSSYVAIAASTGKVPTNTSYWKKLAQGYEDASAAMIPTLDYGTTSDTNLGNGQLRWRQVGNHVYISGGITAKYTGTQKTLMTIDADAAPRYATVHLLRACSGNRVARIYVTTAGEVGLLWIKNISDASDYTSAAIWIDCNFDYWID